MLYWVKVCLRHIGLLNRKQPLHRRTTVPLPDNGVPAKPALWGEFTGEARDFLVGNGALDIPFIKYDEVTPHLFTIHFYLLLCLREGAETLPYN